MTKILVIEDMDEVRANLVDLLEAEGYQLLAAHNGRKGIEIAQQQIPDLILCDILMPEVDGYGVIQEIRREPITAAIPFIFLTARAEASDLRNGMAMGADDYLTKPFTRSDLLQAVATRLKKKEAVVALSEQKMQHLRHNLAQMLPHELRTPITSILGYTSLLLEDFETMQAGDIREMLHSIQSGGERLHQLIQKFLWYLEVELVSRDGNRIAQMRQEILQDPRQLLRRLAIETADSMQRLADLHLEVAETPLPIGEDYLARMVKELLENAFKFSAPNTPVILHSWRNSRGESIIRITDRGRGMTAEQIREIGAFLQFDRNLHEQQGQGMGVAIARRIAELYGGQLIVESVQNDHTTVQVTLPARLNEPHSGSPAIQQKSDDQSPAMRVQSPGG